MTKTIGISEVSVSIYCYQIILIFIMLTIFGKLTTFLYNYNVSVMNDKSKVRKHWI